MGISNGLCLCFQKNTESDGEAVLVQNPSSYNKNNNFENEKNDKQNISSSPENVNNNKKKIVNERNNFDKNLCNIIFKNLPKRETTQLQTFKENLKEKIQNMYDKEKAYIIFLWVCDNIVYDAESLFAGRQVDCDPEGVFKKGTTVCSGYARLFKNI